MKEYRARVGGPVNDHLKATHLGVAKLEGATEEDWFRTWESTLAQIARRGSYKPAAPLVNPFSPNHVW